MNKTYRGVRKALCVLLAALFCWLGAAAGEGGEIPAAQAGEPMESTAAADGEPGASGPAEEALPGAGADWDEAAEMPGDTHEEPSPDAADSGDEAAEPAPEDRPGEQPPDPGEEEAGLPEDMHAPGDDEAPVHWDGTLRVDVACEIDLQEGKLYRLTLPQRTDLILEAGGVPVKVTITAQQSGLTRAWVSEAAGDARGFVLREPLTLEKGEYGVAVEPLMETRKGLVSIRFSTPEAAPAEEETPDADPAVMEETAPEAAPAEEETPDADPAVTEETAPEAAPAEEETPDTDPAVTEETAPEAAPAPEETAAPLTVRVIMTCEERCQPGARIVLRAVVSDPDWQGTIRWQYSADGGETICDVEGAEGAEYSFLLDEVNCTYWWRAWLE